MAGRTPAAALKRALAAAARPARRADRADPLVAELVRAVYRLHLGRDPGREELALRRQEFRRGMAADAFAEGVRRSEEAARFRAAREADPAAAAAPPAAEPRGDDLESLIAGLYLGFLGRRPEAGVMADWERAARDGVGFVEMARQVRDSEEAARVAQSGRLAFSAEAVQTIIGALYRLAHGRPGTAEELEPWAADLAAGRGLTDCAEEITLRAQAAAGGPSDEAGTASFVLEAFQLVAGRLPARAEVEARERRMRLAGLRPEALMMELFRSRGAGEPGAGKLAAAGAVARLGTRGVFQPCDWRRALARPARPARPPAALPTLAPGEDVLVSVICDLAELQDDAEARLAELAGQSLFPARCELLLVVPSAQAGRTAAGALAERHANVRLLVHDGPASAAAACNLAAEAAQGRYLTRATGEDLRRRDALEAQAATLEAFGFADVVYHEVLYSFDRAAPFETAAQADLRSRLPPATPAAFYAFNVTRHAPMWRAALHQEVGAWDEAFGAAADYDFWARCAAAGKTFLKLDEPLSAVLPARADSPDAATHGRAAERVRAAHARALFSPLALQPFAAFCGQVAAVSGAEAPDAEDRHQVVQNALLALHPGPSFAGEP